MEHKIHFPILEKLGLSAGEVLIYELLLESGRLKARDLVVPSGLGRGNVYNILLQLESKGLVLSVQGKQTLYEAVEPSKLQSLIDFKMQEVEDLRKNFQQAVLSLSSMYNLSTGRPTVRVFEGLVGWEKSNEETLISKTDICTYIDVTALVGELAEANRKYVSKRIKKKINKKILIEDTPETRAFFIKQNTPFTQVGFLEGYPTAFATAIQIYDNNVSYLTLNDNKKISIIITNPAIYQTHLAQFEWLWQMADKVDYSETAIGNSTAESTMSASNKI